MIKKEELGKLIQESRKKIGLTQEDLAKKINVSDKAISNWETGKNYPDILVLTDLNKILKLGIEETLIDKKKRKKTLIIISSIVIIFILVISMFLFFYYYKYKNRYLVYEINLNDNYQINYGMLLINKENIIIKLSSINSKLFKKDSSINITLYTNEDNIIIYKRDYQKLDLNWNKNNDDFQMLKNNINDLYLKIEYINKNNENIEDTLKLHLIEIFSTSNQDVVNNNKINLLLNNGYNETNKNFYEKEKIIDKQKVLLSYSLEDRIFQYNYIDGYYEYKFSILENENLFIVNIYNNNLITSVIEKFEYKINLEQLNCQIGDCQNYREIFKIVNNEFIYLKS